MYSNEYLGAFIAAMCILMLFTGRNFARLCDSELDWNKGLFEKKIWAIGRYSSIENWLLKHGNVWQGFFNGVFTVIINYAKEF